MQKSEMYIEGKVVKGLQALIACDLQTLQMKVEFKIVCCQLFLETWYGDKQATGLFWTTSSVTLLFKMVQTH